MSFYRDPLAGLRSQIATKRGRLASQESALPMLLRAMLPETLGRRLTELRALTEGEPESLDALTVLDASLDELLAVYEQVAELVPKLRECPDEVPDPPRPMNLSPPWAFEEPYQLAFRALFTRRLEALAPEAWLVRWDDTTYISRVRLAGAPLVLWARLEVVPGQQNVYRSRVRTSVPGSTPALDVRRGRIFDGVGRALGLVHDDKIGQEVFDEMFIVTAAPGAVALLTSDVTSALLQIEPMAPRLTVRRGVVEVAWRPHFGTVSEPLMPDAALAIVLGVRAAIERA